MTDAQAIRLLTEENRNGLLSISRESFEALGITEAQVMRFARSRGWRYSRTANLNELYLNPDGAEWYVLQTSVGHIYFTPREYADVMACVAGKRACVEVVHDGRLRAACWSCGDITVAQDGQYIETLRVEEIRRK